jgi:hypothetical protein
METLAGFQRTGRVTRGPASELIELLDDNGFPHTAISFYPQYRDHAAIGAALEVVKGFLEAPYVTGLVELVEHLPEEGTFVYATGECWSVYEVIRKLADMGHTAGVRSGLELLFAAGQILIEAAESGEAHAVYSHGGLTPWRVMLKADGLVQIIGHAVPQVEILQFHQDPDEIPKEDAFRYCPPERMDAEDEDLSSDLFSLALIAFELMTGRPVYDGLVNDIRTQAARGEGSRRLFRFKDQLPAAALDLLRVCLKPDIDHRYADGDEFLAAVQKVLASPEAVGPSLMGVMDSIGNMRRAPGEGLEAGKTVALDKDTLRRMVAELEEEGSTPPEPGPPAARESFKPSSARRPRRGRRAPRPEAAEDLTPAESIAEKPKSSVVDSDERWKKPDRGRQARSKSREEPESPPAAPDRARGGAAGADEILRRLKSSSDRPSRRRDRSSSGGDAAKLIESILSSSEDARRSGQKRRVEPEVEPADTEPASELLASQTRKRPARGRRSARRRPSSAAEEAPAAKPSEPRKARRPVREAKEPDSDRTPTAAPRSARASTPDPEPTSPSPAKPKPAEPVPAVAASSVEPELSTVPRPSRVAKDKSRKKPPVSKPSAVGKPPSEPDPPKAPSPARAAKPVPPPERRSPERRSPESKGAAATSLPRAPRRLRATGGSTIPLKLKIAPDGDTFKTRFPTKASLAECVARLTASLLPIQTDLTGRLTQAWRLGPADGPVPGRSLVESQSQDTLLLLHPITFRETVAEISVQDGDVPLRFRAPMSNLTSAATVVDHLVRWLGLPDGDWNLHADERQVGPFELMDEFDLSVTVLVLKR